jgi:acid phosphatase (class A)
MNLDKIKHSLTGKKYINYIIVDLHDSKSKIKKYMETNISEYLPAPPTNSSNFVQKELAFMSKLQKVATKSEKDFARWIHEYSNTYKLFARVANRFSSYKVEPNDLDKFCGTYNGLLNFLKINISRPRPYELATEMGIKHHLLVDKRYTTGSYPSGHAFEAYLLAYNFAKDDSANEEKYMQVADKIAESRIIAGVHYPSDIIAAKILAKQVFDHKI